MLTKTHWNPYVAGALTGLVIVLSVLFAGQYFGASTTFVRLAGYFESLFAPDVLHKLEYYVRVAPRLDWQMFFVGGILLGSLLAALLGQTFRWQSVPDMWLNRFGHTPIKRGIVGFLGGAILMFGARMADG